ncbi:hypothetical protein E2C01_003237 [Portunus trituberculatus]|uniref:Attacin C-terminal domain-containing protein n=1 Tax=Portunus trituberculatus TaxID=210409 RepID=A0A5B7CMD9_PORTR|nr:hypothetical protein [Portunus trituberculatus]
MKPLVITLLLVTLAAALVAGAPYPKPDLFFLSHEYDDDVTSEDSQEDYVRKKRQLSGGFNVNDTPFGKNYAANLGYNHVFNKGRTSFGVTGNKSWGALGKSHGVGVNFVHKFG